MFLNNHQIQAERLAELQKMDVFLKIPADLTKKTKMFNLLSSNWYIYFHPGEYKKDELLEAAR